MKSSIFQVPDACQIIYASLTRCRYKLTGMGCLMLRVRYLLRPARVSVFLLLLLPHELLHNLLHGGGLLEELLLVRWLHESPQPVIAPAAGLGKQVLHGEALRSDTTPWMSFVRLRLRLGSDTLSACRRRG